jgi:hypothetical protein
MNKRIVGIVLVSMLLVALLGTTVAFAQVSWEDVTKTENNDDGPPFPGGWRSILKDLVDLDEIKAKIATALGISVEDLEAARQGGMRLPQIAEEQGVEIETLKETMTEIREELIQSALDQGLIDEDQAAAIREHEGRMGIGPRFRKGIGPLGELDHQVLLAEALGIPLETLEADLAEGKTIRDLIEEYEVDIDSFREVMESTRTEALEQAVEDGVITPEQAEKLLERGIGRGPGCGMRGEGGFGKHLFGAP